MPQVIVKVEPDKFYYALQTNMSRRPVIREGCSTKAEVSLRCAQEFHRLYPVVLTRHPTRHQRNEQIAHFHKRYCHIRLCMEGNRADGGFIVVCDELIGLHNVKPGTGDWMMREAISLGADRLDTYDVPHLIELYNKHGFHEVLREANTIKGKPDVVWMRREQHHVR
jgi:hypothetical protein